MVDQHDARARGRLDLLRRHGRAGVRRDTGLGQEGLQIAQVIARHILAVRRAQRIVLRADRHIIAAVVTFAGRADVVQQGDDIVPLDIASDRMPEDAGQRCAMMAVQMRGGHAGIILMWTPLRSRLSETPSSLAWNSMTTPLSFLSEALP